ncbi:cytochrome c3 family protein [Thermodesulfatator autotrophicus]|uniref:Doubled CXXCH motif domain-containing protein n=1 Tax=Thermodesulfatator autotrophicus TaxID=1795632 RepID=A0A177E6Y5_9BACT|nr:cytochrome c3 family protein [Thermodesulfatator autotrophicus]OAG27704.1 hypothetical protein TH606_05355 [Thermodesulfatator autotrophicus]
MKRLFLFLISFSVVLVLASSGKARVSGMCSNCHTMHNSQNGQVVSGNGPHMALTKYDCVGCHSSSESSTTYMLGNSVVPVVLYTGGNAPTNYLAGGNFWWVKEGLGNTDGQVGDPKGHNVFLNEDDDFLTEAPGSAISCTNSCHIKLSQPSIIEGKYGCTGCHVYPKHHADDHPNGNYNNVVGESGGWYRYLAAAHTTGYGVEGIEDNDWEATVSASDHNEYFGKPGNLSGTGGFMSIQANTMTAYCTGCHGNFHIENDNAGGGSPWLRHPSDAVIPSSGEYANYTVYNPLAPVARPDLTALGGPSATVTPGQDMVMCLSCHRPHGTPYDDILRWDYSQCTVGDSTNCGCFVCHTNKGIFQ